MVTPRQLLLAVAGVLAALLAPSAARARVGDGSAMLASGLGTRNTMRTNAGMRANIATQTLENLYSTAHRGTASSMAQADGGGASPVAPMASAPSLMRFAAARGGGLARTAVGSYSMGQRALRAGSGESHSGAGLDAIAKQAKLIGSTAAAAELAKELAWEKHQQELHQHRGW